MVELKACPNPWCDETRDLELTGYTLDRFVICGSCGCASPSAKTDEEAIAAWNHRPPTDEALRIAVEALEDILSRSHAKLMQIDARNALAKIKELGK